MTRCSDKVGRNRRRSYSVALLALLVWSAGILAQPAHFDSKGKPPSSFTTALQESLRQTLPFEDQRDFEESRRGFIAAPDSQQILGSRGNVVWDRSRYDFLLNNTDYDSIHPSLQRQALLNKLVYAEPANQAAKDLLADVFEQLGYQYESASMRNVFLSAARELRQGAPDIPAARGTSPDLARAMTTTQWWDAVATRVDSGRADSLQFIINFRTPDTAQEYVVELSGGTLTNIEGFQSDQADATVVMNRSDLDAVIMGQATLAEQLQAGIGTISGDQSVLLQLASLLVEFDPGFEVMPGTR